MLSITFISSKSFFTKFVRKNQVRILSEFSIMYENSKLRRVFRWGAYLMSPWSSNNTIIAWVMSKLKNSEILRNLKSYATHFA